MAPKNSRYSKYSTHSKYWAIFLVAGALTGCGTTNQTPDNLVPFPNACTPDPQGINSGLNLNLTIPDKAPDLLTIGDRQFCVGYQLKEQQLSGTSGITIFPGGEDNTLTACVPRDTRYNANAHVVALQPPPLNPTIVPPPPPQCVTSGRIDFPVELRFSLNYRAVWAPNLIGSGLCIFRSRVDYSQFDVTNFDRIDTVLQDRVREDIHRQIDLSAANEINLRTILSGATGRRLAEGSDPRCSDWQELNR